MKFLVAAAIFVCFAVVSICPVTGEREFEKYVERNQHLIPREMINRLFRERRANPAGSHWCCAEDVNKPITVQRTRIVQAYREGYHKVRTGSSKCGSFGWRRCSLYGVRTYKVSFTYLTQFEQDLDRTCKTHELICCHGYVLLNKSGGNNCFALADLDKEQMNLLKRLKGFDGLLGR